MNKISIVVMETLKQSWKQTVLWGIGLGAMCAMVVMMVPLFEMQSIKSLLESFPPALLAAAGIGTEFELFATEEGFVAMGFFSKSLLIFAVYPVVMGMRVTSQEEDSGIFAFHLSLPMSRSQILVGKFLAYAVSTILVVLLIFVGLYVGAVGANVRLDMGKMASVTWYLLPLMVLIMAVTVGVAAAVRRRQTALGIVTGFVVVSYVLQALGAMDQGGFGGTIGQASVFTYYDTGKILANGANMTHIAGFVVVSVVMLAFGLMTYERRDLGV